MSFADNLILKSHRKSGENKKSVIEKTGCDPDEYIDEFMFCLIDNSIDYTVHDVDGLVKCLSDDICEMFLRNNILIETTDNKQIKAFYDAYIRDGLFCEKCISFEDFKRLTAAKYSSTNDEYIEKLSGTDIFILINLLHKVHRTHSVESSKGNYSRAD